MAPAVLLWDFGDTLVDERWMLRAPATCPTWPTAWSEIMSTRADGWNVGACSPCQVSTVSSSTSGYGATDGARPDVAIATISSASAVGASSGTNVRDFGTGTNVAPVNACWRRLPSFVVKA